MIYIYITHMCDYVSKNIAYKSTHGLAHCISLTLWGKNTRCSSFIIGKFSDTASDIPSQVAWWAWSCHLWPRQSVQQWSGHVNRWTKQGFWVSSCPPIIFHYAIYCDILHIVLLDVDERCINKSWSEFKIGSFMIGTFCELSSERM